jgi:hypothetical protein
MIFILSKAGPSKSEVQKEIKAMEAAGKKIRASKKSARAYLVKYGFITKDNALHPNYR